MEKENIKIPFYISREKWQEDIIWSKEGKKMSVNTKAL